MVFWLIRLRLIAKTPKPVNFRVCKIRLFLNFRHLYLFTRVDRVHLFEVVNEFQVPVSDPLSAAVIDRCQIRIQNVDRMHAFFPFEVENHNILAIRHTSFLRLIINLSQLIINRIIRTLFNAET